MPPFFRTLVLSALLPAAALPSLAAAASIVAVQSGDWSDPATWNLGRVPAPGDQAGIGAGTTVTVTTAVAGGPSLSVASGGTLSVAASGHITLCSTCQMDNAGTIVVDGTMQLGGAGPGTFDNRATLNIGADGTLVIATGAALAHSYGTITNNGRIANDGSLLIDANGLTTLNNNGVLDTRGDIVNEVILQNAGTINLLGSSTLDNKYRLSSTGNARITIAADAVLRTSELFTASNATAIVNRGTFLMLGGGALLNAGTVFDHYGDILGTASLSVAGTFNKYCGATIAAGAVSGPVTDICADTVFVDGFE